MADFLGTGDPDTIAFGPNMTSLTFALSRALAKTWHPGDEVLVARLDHDANEWITAYELGLVSELLDGLGELPGVRVWGITDRYGKGGRIPSRCPRRYCCDDRFDGRPGQRRIGESQALASARPATTTSVWSPKVLVQTGKQSTTNRVELR